MKIFCSNYDVANQQNLKWLILCVILPICFLLEKFPAPMVVLLLNFILIQSIPTEFIHLYSQNFKKSLMNVILSLTAFVATGWSQRWTRQPRKWFCWNQKLSRSWCGFRLWKSYYPGMLSKSEQRVLQQQNLKHWKLWLSVNGPDLKLYSRRGRLCLLWAARQ